MFSITSDSKWYAAITNPNCQRRAELELYSLGYRTFAPKLRKWVSHARVRKAVERPLLGRYLFIEISSDQSFGAVRNVNGVEGFVSVCGYPAVVPDRYLDDFRMRYMAGEWDFVSQGMFPDGQGSTRVNQPYPIGARVTIVEGEFSNLLATITNRKRDRIGVKILDTAIHKTIFDVSVRPAA